MRVTGAAEHFSGTCTGHFAFVDDRDAVDQDIVHSLRKLIGIVEGGEVADRGGIEDHDIGPHAGAEKAAAFEPQALSWLGGEFADGVFESELVLFANVFAQDTGERAVGARMRMFLTENSFG